MPAFDHREVLTVATVGRLALAVLQRRASPEELLDGLRAIVPYDAAHISYCDPATGAHVPLASIAYTEDTLGHLMGRYVRTCPAYRVSRAAARCMRMRDIPFDFYRTETYEMALAPAGFDEGVTLCLKTADGRYTGMLTMSTMTRSQPTDRACEILNALAPTLAHVTDVALTPAWLCSVLEPGKPAIGVTEDGAVLQLSAEPGDWFTGELDAIVEAARRLLRSSESRAGYYLEDPRGGWHALCLVRAPAGTIDGRPCAIATIVRHDAPPYGLTARELDVLTMMATGAHNREIAATLGTSPRTVSTHVEHILEKLACVSRTAAAARAVAEGLLRLHR